MTYFNIYTKNNVFIIVFYFIPGVSINFNKQHNIISYNINKIHYPTSNLKRIQKVYITEYFLEFNCKFNKCKTIVIYTFITN